MNYTARKFSSQHQQLESMVAYASEHMLFKYGNQGNVKSRFNWVQRWYLERKLMNYNNQKVPMFYFAYRAFLDAMAA